MAILDESPAVEAAPAPQKTSRARLSAPQRRILEQAASHRIGRVVGGDPRARESLLRQGWIAVDGHHFGPLFVITEAGHAALASATKKKAASLKTRSSEER